MQWLHIEMEMRKSIPLSMLGSRENCNILIFISLLFLHEKTYILQIPKGMHQYFLGCVVLNSSLAAYTIRKAADKDRDFLYSLHRVTMKPYVDLLWGWDEDWQEQYFTQHFDPQTLQIIQVKDRDIGVISVEYGDQEIFLRIIEILPSFQNRGIGTSIIKNIMKEALSTHKSIILQVLKKNPRARTLYERLEFSIYEETETHYKMRYLG